MGLPQCRSLIEPAVLPLCGRPGISVLRTYHIYSLISEGKLDARKFGKKVLISKESCDRFLAGLPAAERAQVRPAEARRGSLSQTRVRPIKRWGRPRWEREPTLKIYPWLTPTSIAKRAFRRKLYWLSCRRIPASGSLSAAVPGGVELRLATAHPDGRISPKSHAFKLRDSLLRAAATALVQAADAADAEAVGASVMSAASCDGAPRVAKLVRLLGSPNEHERLASLNMLGRTLRAGGSDFNDLASRLDRAPDRSAIGAAVAVGPRLVASPSPGRSRRR